MKNVITTPFADDFNLITNNKTIHQKLLSDVEEKIKSMGLVLKPRKCRSLSIIGGKTVNSPFYLHEKQSEKTIQIASVIDQPMKFLGSQVAGENNPSAMFASLQAKLKQKLENIDKSTLRGEYKVNIYSRYALPSLRFYFSVHQLHKTHEESLDSMTRLYLKKWLKIQKHGVTDAAIFHPYMLNIKAPSQLYQEAHAGNYALVRAKGDELVNHALDSRLERESAWTRKHSTIVTVQRMWKENHESGKISIPQDTETQEHRKKHVTSAKKAMMNSVKTETMLHWNTKVKKLTFQADFIKLLIDESSNVTWKSITNNVPKGVLSFALKACSNGLNTPDNLRRWGIRKTDKCDLCKNRSNLEHILNWCPKSLKEGRFTWRHNSVLSYFGNELLKCKPQNLQILVDLPGLWLNGGTIPPDILVTSLRPDIALINREEKKIELLELTCSFEKNIEEAYIRKYKKYLSLKTDIEKTGWSVRLVPFEVGSRGQITKRNTDSLIQVFKRNSIKVKHKPLFINLGKVALLCSYSIFQAHCVPMWQDPPLLHP